jgi:hypothetical protein
MIPTQNDFTDFDRSKPNIILMSDNTDTLTMIKIFGLHKVAHVLRQEGFEVAVINHLSVFSVEEIKHLLSNLVSDQTLFVGVNNFYYLACQELLLNEKTGGIEIREGQQGSILPHGKIYNQEIKQLIRSINPQCRLVCGGPNQIDAEFNRDFDYVVIGYAEMSVVNLARHLQSKSVPLDKSYRSIYGPRIINDPKAEGYDFSQSQMQYQMIDAVLPGETLYLEIGRGCIFNCSFCSFPMNGKKKFDYIRHRDLIVDELIDNYEKFKTTKYLIVDDTFNDSYEKCEMIYEIAQALPFKIEYWAFIRLDLLAAKPEAINLLIDSGCRGMYFGIETFNSRTATAIRKGGSREKLMQTIKHIKQTWGKHVSLHGSFILGLPYESVESMQTTIEYLMSDKNQLDSWQIQALRLKHKDYHKNTNPGFLSDLDRNYEKYGYRPTGKFDETLYSGTNERKSSEIMLWENDYTNFEDMRALANQTRNLSRQNKRIVVTNNRLFELSGLDIPLDEILNVPHVDMDWHRLDKAKLSRATKYKKIMFENFHIPESERYQSIWDSELAEYKTFTNYLLAQARTVDKI